MRGSWASALAISTRRFIPPDSARILLSRLSPQRHLPQHLAHVGRVGRLAEQAAADAAGGADRLERVGGQLLRDQADQRAGGAEGTGVVMAVHGDRAAAGSDDAADGADQGGLAGAVGAEQGEDLAAMDVEVDALEGLEARGVGFG